MSKRLKSILVIVCFISLGLAAQSTARTVSVTVDPNIADFNTYFAENGYELVLFWGTTKGSYSHTSQGLGGGTYAINPDQTITYTLDLPLEKGVTYYFSARANDYMGNISSLSAEVPTANAGGDRIVLEKKNFILNGVSSDPDSSVSTASWLQTDGTPGAGVVNADNLNGSFTAPSVTQDATLTFALTVTHSNGYQATDTCDVTVQNDADGDTVADAFDAFPNDPNEWSDGDGDGYGDNADAFPNDPTEWLDSDGDGYGNNTDAFPYDATEWLDSDGDGYGDNADIFPNDPTEWLDSDGDGIGDNADTIDNNSPSQPPPAPDTVTDTDGDGVADSHDAFPNDPTETTDTDNDGIGNGRDEDDDNDGMSDAWENLNAHNPLVHDSSRDVDGNGLIDIVDFIEDDSLAGTKLKPPVLTPMYETTENEPMLDWDNVDGANYYILQYAADAYFTQPRFAGGLAGSMYQVDQPLADGTWNWTVAAVDDTGKIGDWAAPGSFTVNNSNYCGQNPPMPTALAPLDNSSGVSLPLTLKTKPFSDSCSNVHWKTRWEISDRTVFTNPVFSATTEWEHLTSLEIPESVLLPDTTYYWRVRFWSNVGNKSPWSNTFTFTTAADARDSDNNGIPDNMEVGALVDLNNDGISDLTQPAVIKSLYSFDGAMEVGFNPATGSIDNIEALNDRNIAFDDQAPLMLPFGLFAYRIKVANFGDEAQIKVYFGQSLDYPTVKWYKYDSVLGWTDYSDHAVFNADKSMVTLTLKDGGYGDSDYVENGIIVDPGGIGVGAPAGGAVVSSPSPVAAAGGGGGGGCFIATAAYGSLFEPHVVLLRQFRDRFLKTNVPGRMFVSLYYRYSPAIAARIAGSEAAKFVIRWSLLPLVGTSWLLLHFGAVGGMVCILGLLLLPYFLIRHVRRKKQEQPVLSDDSMCLG